MKKLLKNNGLSLVLMAMFLVTVVLQILAGRGVYNDEQAEHGGQSVTMLQYFATGHLWESLGENWKVNFCRWPRSCC